MKLFSSRARTEDLTQWQRPLAEAGNGFVGPSGGRASVVSAPVEYQATTTQACGFNPWMVGAAAPMVGTPVGVHVRTGEGIACDPLTWFAAGIISNPSGFVLSLPGLGKSTLMRKMLIGSVARGQVPVVAGDMKGEYVGITQAMGGQVITLGHGHGHLNPLAAGVLGAALEKMQQHEDELIAKGLGNLIPETGEAIHSRQVIAVSALLQLIRQAPVADFEHSMISVALRGLRESGAFSFSSPPLMVDLVEAIETGSERLRIASVSSDPEEYRRTMRPLAQSLRALLDGVLGNIFADHTTHPIDLNATAICIDVSSIDRGDKVLKAAVMLSCWSDAYASIEAAHLLADAGLEKQKNFLCILDELWSVLGAGITQRVDELTRLNRTDGTGLLMITHTARDLESLPTEADVKTAMGFIERAGMVISGGLPSGELTRLADVLSFSPAEAQMITSWSRGTPLARRKGRQRVAPIGRGKFMIKPAKDGSAGIPLQTLLTPTEIELSLHDTNARFSELIGKNS